MTKKKQKLYALLHIGPTGFNDVRLQFVENLPENAFTDGEGQCLIFKLDKYDLSTNFNDAFEKGIITEKLSRLFHPVKLLNKRYWKQSGSLLRIGESHSNSNHKYIFLYDRGCHERTIDWDEIQIEDYMFYKKELDKGDKND